VSLRRRRRLDETRARFINELAHDLRTPLTSLRLYAEMLAAGKTPEEERPRYVETMARESGRLSALLANLLDLSRLERGSRDFARERIGLEEAVGRALADFAALHPARADDVRVSGPDDATVTADSTALARVLGNLLDNAGKFTEEGTTIRISWRAPADGEVELALADQGPGIPAEERGRLFRRYERGERAKADGVPGTGLGLALVRELVEGMGGRVRLAPSESGSRFEVTLPGGGDE
jgi:two-component system phosphate regulon sensor histidine kinase PhoR